METREGEGEGGETYGSTPLKSLPLWYRRYVELTTHFAEVRQRAREDVGDRS